MTADLPTWPVVRVLVIEDDEMDARLLEEHAKDEGLEGIRITVARSMRDAEQLLTAIVFDVVLLDLGLPDAPGGIATLRKFKARHPTVPVHILTGLEDPEMDLIAIREGAESYIVKGAIMTRQLLSGLQQAVIRRGAEYAARHAEDVELAREAEEARIGFEQLSVGYLDTKKKIDALLKKLSRRGGSGNAPGR